MATLPPFSLRQAFWGLSSLFLFLFVGRLIYGYYYPGDPNNFNEQASAGSFGSRKNYASEKIRNKDLTTEHGPGTASPALSQKYEKVATLSAKTSRFDQDEATIKSKIKAFDAVIQFEQNNGNAGQRTLQLLVGVQPEEFDSFYVEMQKIGRVLSRQVTKTDKTNEYLKLNAQITSLTKTRNALLELKNRGGQIEEYIGLENRVLEIETQLQDLGVQMGDYDEENEFCSVRLTLVEGESRHIGLAQRLKVALEWSVPYFCGILLGLVFAFVAALILLQITDKVKSAPKTPNP